MRMQDFDVDDGRRVWLSQDDLDLFISHAKDVRHEAAFRLGAESGLRRGEIVSITPTEFFQAPEGWLRVPPEYTKSDRYRETPISVELEHMVRGMAGDEDDPVVGVSAGNTIRRWVRRAADLCEDETGDEGWSYLTPHDLRRTWGGHLLWDRGVLPAVVMNWGGWEDWRTFREHYLGEMSPAAASRERAKAFGTEAASDPVFEPTVDLGGSGRPADA